MQEEKTVPSFDEFVKNKDKYMGQPEQPVADADGILGADAEKAAPAEPAEAPAAPAEEKPGQERAQPGGQKPAGAPAGEKAPARGGIV